MAKSGLTKRAPDTGILPYFQAFFWIRVFPAPKQNPRPPSPLTPAVGNWCYDSSVGMAGGHPHASMIFIKSGEDDAKNFSNLPVFRFFDPGL